jgi:thiol-disulfide isomerase/thioredoxin
LSCSRVASIIVVLVVVSSAIYLPAETQRKATGRSTANPEMAKAEAAQKAGDYKSALEHFRIVAEHDPNNVVAHKYYVILSRNTLVEEKMKEWDHSHPELSSPDEKVAATLLDQRVEYEGQVRRNLDSRLFEQYQKWSRKYPRNAIFLWSLGIVSEERDPQAAEQYYQKAIEADPKLVDAYDSLSTLQEVMGELAAYRATLRKAAAALPNDPNLLFHYASAIKSVDPDEYKRLTMEIMEKFPDSQRAPQALYWLADGTPTPEEKVRILESLRAKFLAAKSMWASAGMLALFNAYDQSDRSKALALAEEMVKEDPKPEYGPDTWTQRAKYATAMIAAEKLLDEGKPKDALTTLDPVLLPRQVEGRWLVLLRSRATDAAGDTAKAYSNLLKNFAITPTDEFRQALDRYGEKLGKNYNEIETDVWSQLGANARPATPFSLFNYATRKPTSLADFQGHVVLLNFWYPHCGPCRGEFPYINAALNKYKNRGFQIVAVNVYPAEDAEVLPLLKGFGMDFIPLKTNSRWAKENYRVEGEPTNYLVGADGRIYFGPLGPIHSLDAQRTLELQVESLLQHTSKPAAGSGQ